MKRFILLLLVVGLFSCKKSNDLYTRFPVFVECKDCQIIITGETNTINRMVSGSANVEVAIKKDASPLVEFEVFNNSSDNKLSIKSNGKEIYSNDIEVNTVLRIPFSFATLYPDWRD